MPSKSAPKHAKPASRKPGVSPSAKPEKRTPKPIKASTKKHSDTAPAVSSAAPKPSKSSKAPIASKVPKGPKAAKSNGSHPVASKQGSNGHHAPAADGEAIVIAPPDPAALNRPDSPEIQDKLRELVKLAKEQGYITFDDLSEILPDSVNEPEEMDAIMTRLRAMEIDIIDASQVDTYKDGKKVFEKTETIRQEFMRNRHEKNVGMLAKPFADKIADRLKEANLAAQ